MEPWKQDLITGLTGVLWVGLAVLTVFALLFAPWR